MKLDIDSICEGKIRHYQDIINTGSIGDPEVYKKLCEAALLVAGSMGAKLTSHDTFNNIGKKQ